jgi:hypothetical protein
MQITVFFLTHLFNREVQRRYRKLKNQLPENHRLVILADKKYGKNFTDSKGAPILFFDSQEISEEIYANRLKNANSRLIPGNIDQLFIWASEKYMDSSYYWLIEFDVVLTGNWQKFLSTFVRNDTDFLATSFQRKSDCLSWTKWHSFSPPKKKAKDISEHSMLRCFTPVMRLSARARNFLIKEYSESLWQGHMESIVPTALFHAGFSIEDLGGNSFMTPKERLNHWYTSTLYCETLSPGTFRYRPSMRVPGHMKNMIYHPVKTVDRFHDLFYVLVKIGVFFRFWRI